MSDLRSVPPPTPALHALLVVLDGASPLPTNLAPVAPHFDLLIALQARPGPQLFPPGFDRRPFARIYPIPPIDAASHPLVPELRRLGVARTTLAGHPQCAPHLRPRLLEAGLHVDDLGHPAEAPRIHPPETLWHGGHFHVKRRLHWEYLTRRQATGAVVIAALTPEDRVLVVEQFRPPVNARTLELPAGLIGDTHGTETEAALEAARRELLEETGWEARHLEIAAHGPSTPGTCDEIITLVVARDLHRVERGGGVDDENILVHEIPRSGMREWIARHQAEGWLVDVKVLAGLACLEACPKPALPIPLS